MKKSFLIFIIILLIIIIVPLFVLKNNNTKEEQVEQEKTQVEELHLPTTPTISKNTNGTLTIYDKDGNIWYQYAGDINVENSGEDGNPVEISITIPDDRSGTQLMEVPTD